MNVRHNRLSTSLATTVVNHSMNQPVSHPPLPSLEKNQRFSNQSETDVIYVEQSNAKKTKIELESLGYLDKRYKMIATDSLIALPVTETYLSYRNMRKVQNMGNDCKYAFENMIVKIGKETVPLSSSSMGRLKQKR